MQVLADLARDGDRAREDVDLRAVGARHLDGDERRRDDADHAFRIRVRPCCEGVDGSRALADTPTTRRRTGLDEASSRVTVAAEPILPAGEPREGEVRRAAGYRRQVLSAEYKCDGNRAAAVAVAV